MEVPTQGIMPGKKSGQYCAGGQIEKNEMGRTCGAYGGGKRGAQGVSWET
jgi:hypothetical protein